MLPAYEKREMKTHKEIEDKSTSHVGLSVMEVLTFLSELTPHEAEYGRLRAYTWMGWSNPPRLRRMIVETEDGQL